jgi:hypothetical protein
MGVITEAQTMEMQSDDEGVRWPVIYDPGSVDTRWAHGGDFCRFEFGREGQRALAAPSTEITTGYWLKTDGSLADVLLFAAFSVNPGDPDDWEITAYINWDQGDQELELWYDAGGPSWIGAHDWTIVDVVSVYQTKLQRTNNWAHVSLYSDHQIRATWSLYLDGIQIQSYTAGTNWEWLTAPNYWGHWITTSSGTTFTYRDSGYIEDVNGEGDQVPNGYKFVMALPDGAGSSSQWTPDAGTNYARVNEATAPDEDTSYVDSAVSELDLYTFVDLTEGPANELPYWNYLIYGVYMQTYFRGVDDGEAARANYDHYVWDGALSLTDGPFEAPAADFDWRMAFSFFPLQPDGTSWNLVDFNAWTYGIETN